MLTFFFFGGIASGVGFCLGQELDRGETEVRYGCLSAAARLLNVSLVFVLFIVLGEGPS